MLEDALVEVVGRACWCGSLKIILLRDLSHNHPKRMVTMAFPQAWGTDILSRGGAVSCPSLNPIVHNGQDLPQLESSLAG